MKRLFYLSTLFMLFACSPSETEDQAALLALNQTLDLFNEAFRDGNLAVLDSLTTDNYIHTNSADKAFSKSSWFNYLNRRSEQIRSGTLDVTEYDLLEKEIRLHGSSAIITGKIVMAGSMQGEPFQRQIRVSNLWVNDNGVWKRAGFHDTRIE